GEHELALAIAQGTTRREDRLLLLAALARSRREAKLPVPAELEEQIAQLHEGADYDILGDRSETLAVDLMYCRPDLALKTVERAKAATRASSTLKAADWSYARLAVEVGLAEQESGRSTEQVAAILERIKDPKAMRLATEAAIVFGNSSAAEAIKQAERLSNAED